MGLSCALHANEWQRFLIPAQGQLHGDQRLDNRWIFWCGGGGLQSFQLGFFQPPSFVQGARERGANAWRAYLAQRIAHQLLSAIEIARSAQQVCQQHADI